VEAIQDKLATAPLTELRRKARRVRPPSSGSETDGVDTTNHAFVQFLSPNSSGNNNESA
jgi:hypothetical protein